MGVATLKSLDTRKCNFPPQGKLVTPMTPAMDAADFSVNGRFATYIKLQSSMPSCFLVEEPVRRSSVKQICGIESVKGTRIFYDEKYSQFCFQDKRRVVIVTSVYLAHDSFLSSPTQELQDLVACGKSNSLKLLIGCDDNAQYVCWESSKCNPRGKKLLEFILGG